VCYGDEFLSISENFTTHFAIWFRGMSNKACLATERAENFEIFLRECFVNQNSPQMNADEQCFLMKYPEKSLLNPLDLRSSVVKNEFQNTFPENSAISVAKNGFYLLKWTLPRSGGK
jgi:hypothetical protein